MKIAIDWLKELVEIKKPIEQVAQILTDKTVSVKELTDETMELDMKGYNRADLLSLRGVAYEIAAITDSEVKFGEPKVSEFEWIDKTFPKVEVLVKDEKRCPVYCIAKIEGLKVEKSSPQWIKKLEDSGLRSINNVADVTNLAMLEFGQPMHAFDAQNVKDGTIIVRTAKEGETTVTLDNKKRLLSPSELLITDSENILGIAGVMGGKESEIKNSTTSIMLEVAIFEPAGIRKTAAKLGLQSEASKRFYHGLTKKRLFQALDAAVRMYEQLGGRVTALNIVGDKEDEQLAILLTLKKTNSLTGIDFKPEEVEVYLRKLCFDISYKSGSGGAKDSQNDDMIWQVTPPYYRLDIEFEEDLIEEVARMYGYEKIPSIELKPLVNEDSGQSIFDLIDKLKHELADLGLTEVQTYSFYSTQVLQNLGWYEPSKTRLFLRNEDDNLKHLIKIKNPISSETEYMRMTVWPNLVEVAAKNIKNGVKNIAIFEIGKMYSYEKEEKIEEGYELAVVISDKEGGSLGSLYEVYKEVAKMLGLPYELSPADPPQVVKHLFHPNKFLPVIKNGKQIGGLSELHPRISDKFGVDQRIAILGIDLSAIKRQ